jgi:hypothetical protein
LFADQQNRLESRLNICQEPLRMIPEVIYARKEFYLLGEINEGIEEIKSAGLYEFWQNEFLAKSKAPKFLNTIRSLNLKHFEGSFGLLIAGNLIGLIAFVGELLVNKSKRRLQGRKS